MDLDASSTTDMDEEILWELGDEITNSWEIIEGISRDLKSLN